MNRERREALRARYANHAIPPCRVCGAPLQIGEAGMGRVIWHCSSEAAVAVRYEWGAPEEVCAREHWAASRFIQTDFGDPEVLQLLAALDVAEAREAVLRACVEEYNNVNHWGRGYGDDSGLNEWLPIGHGYAPARTALATLKGMEEAL